MGWDGAILTDSGGFQVFSLREPPTIDDTGVDFRSVYDGSQHRFTPELAMEIQRLLGSDIAMAFDECPPAGVETRQARGRCPADVALGRSAAARARRLRDSSCSASSRAASTSSSASGALPTSSRSASTATRSAACPWARAATRCSPPSRATAEMLPAERPRYFMGIGDPDGRHRGDRAGVDMFDCVLPTRLGRTGRRLSRAGGSTCETRSTPRRAAAGGGLHVPGVRDLLARVHPASGHAGRDRRAAPAHAAQPARALRARRAARARRSGPGTFSRNDRSTRLSAP